MSGKGRGRVKRRSPPINAQFTVVARAAAVRRLRLYDPKCNRVACLRRSNEFSHGLGRGRVKRRSPPINAQFTVVARAAAVRRLRLYDPKCNRVACLRRSNEFSHGLGHEEWFPPPRLNGRCRFGQATFIGTHGNEQDAPKPAARLSWVERVKPTLP